MSSTYFFLALIPWKIFFTGFCDNYPRGVGSGFHSNAVCTGTYMRWKVFQGSDNKSRRFDSSHLGKDSTKIED